jgi:hypothetical protein
MTRPLAWATGPGNSRHRNRTVSLKADPLPSFRTMDRDTGVDIET